jgi:RecA/RadA recombinase
MTKPFDLSKFRKSLTKSIDGLGIGFKDPTEWVSTGNYALNYLISGDFNRGVPLGKVTMLAGESGCLPSTARVRVRHGSHADPQTITVGQLKVLHTNGQTPLEISTPDGFHPITDWFDKGPLPMVRLTANNGLTTDCAVNHLLQRDDNSWVPAGAVQVGDCLLTELGLSTVDSIQDIDSQECFDFTVDHDNHRYWGDGFSSHNSGKSYICSGNIVRNAQQQGIFVVLVDTENALDKSWLEALNVDTSEDKLLKVSMAMIDDVARLISEFVKEYRGLPEDQRPKVLFVIDSLGMLLTPTDVNQFGAGDLKGDMGRKPKALNALVRNCVNMFGTLDIGLVATNHTYASQDPYNPDPNITGGQAFVYASSIVVAMKKLKLKEDEAGNKISEVRGIRAGCKVVKSRYSKPFEAIEIKIPWDTGMNPFSGLFDLFEQKNIVTKEGNRYCYVDQHGEVHKYFRKEWNANENGIMDLVMSEFSSKIKTTESKLVEDELED